MDAREFTKRRREESAAQTQDGIVSARRFTEMRRGDSSVPSADAIREKQSVALNNAEKQNRYNARLNQIYRAKQRKYEENYTNPQNNGQAAMQLMGYGVLAEALRNRELPKLKKETTKTKETLREGNPAYNDDYAPGVDYPKFRTQEDIDYELSSAEKHRAEDLPTRYPDYSVELALKAASGDAEAKKQIDAFAAKYAEENDAYDKRIAELKKEKKDSKNKAVAYRREKAASGAAAAETERFGDAALADVGNGIKAAQTARKSAEAAQREADAAETALHDYEDALRANGVSEQYFGTDSRYIELAQAANDAKKSAESQKNAADADLYTMRGAQTLKMLPEASRNAIFQYVACDGTGIVDTRKWSGARTIDLQSGQRKYVTKDEFVKIRDAYNTAIAALRESGASEEDIDRMLAAVRISADTIAAAGDAETIADLSLRYPVAMSAASVITNLSSGLAAGIGEAGRAVGNAFREEGYQKPMNIYGAAYAPTRMTNDIRGTIAERIEEDNGTAGKVGSFAYQTLMSTADSVVSSVLGNVGGAAAIGGSAYASAIVDAKEKGETDAQALATGIAAGIFETLFEKVSIGNFNALKEVPPATLRDVAKNVVKSTVVNASEEAATEIANIIADAIIGGDLSGYAEAYNGYLAEGGTPSEAKRKALLDMAKQVGMAALGGAVQGGFMGGIGTTWGYFANRDANREAGNLLTDNTGNFDANMKSALVKDGLASQNEEVRRYAQSLDGKSVDTREAGQLMRMIAETGGSAQNTFDEAMRRMEDTTSMRTESDIRSQLGDAENADAVAAALYRMQSGDITQTDARTVKNSAEGRELFSAYFDANISENSTTAQISEAVRDAGTDADFHNLSYEAQGLLKKVREKYGHDADTEFYKAYFAGRTGRTYSGNSPAAMSAYEAGADAKADIGTFRAVGGASLSKETADMMQRAAKSLGVSVTYGGKGSIVGDGVRRGYVNAYGNIHIYEDAKVRLTDGTVLSGGDAAAQIILGHELTHVLQKQAPEAYRALEEHVRGEDDFDAEIKRYMQYGDLTRQEAMDEFVADYAMTTLFADAKTAREVTKKHSKLAEAIRNALAWIREHIFHQTNANAVDRAAKIWNDAYNEARRNKNSAANAGSAGAKNSTAYADDTITTADVEAIRSIGRKSINDFSSEDVRATEKWARKFYRELGTKSPFFRAWFGDWRAHDTGKVDVVSVPTIDIQDATLKYGEYHVNDTGWDVYAGRTLKGDTMHHSGGERINVKSLNSIQSILQNAVLLDTVVSENDTNKKAKYTAFLHKLYTPIVYNDKNYIAVATVEEYYDESKSGVSRRAYNLKNIKVESADGRLENKVSTSPMSDTDSTAISISDLYALVKRYDKDFKPKSVNPVLLNEDGTPKMFYHGTGEDFTAFEPEQMSAREGSFFFAENREDAEAYGDRVMEVYLSGNNLADYDNQPSEFYKLRDKRKQVEYLKERGYDGWYADMDSGGWGEVSVFSPTQIKSATDNIGTFDGANADIRYSTTATDEARLAAERKRGTYAAVTAGLRQSESDTRKAKREFLPDMQTLGEVTRSLAEMGLADGVTRTQLSKAVQDAAVAMRAAYLERNSAEAKARKRTTAAGKLLAAARLLAQKDGVTVAETAEAISAALYQTNTADRKTVKQLVEEYGAIEPGAKPSRVVSVPRKTDTYRDVSKAVRTVMEARITPDTMLPTIEDAIESGDFSYEAITDKAAAARARKTVKTSYQAALDKFHEDVRRGVVSKDTAVLGFELYNQAANANTEESRRTAAGILTDIVSTSRSSAQALQAMKLIKKMSPDYQLYSVERIAQKLNGDLAKRNLKQSGAKKSVEDAILAGQEDAKNGVADEIGELGNGVPAEKWVETVGDIVADGVAARLSGESDARGKTVPQTMRADLAKLANEFLPQKTANGKPRTVVDRVSDYFANRAAYDEAWQEAKQKLKEKYGGDADGIDLLDALLTTTRALSDGEIDRAVAAAVRAVGADMSEIIRSGSDARSETLRAVQRLLIQSGIDAADAQHAADVIAERFAALTEQKSRAALEQVLAGKPGGIRKTAEERFNEYANMGAFEGEYSDAIAEKLFGAPIKVNEKLVRQFRAAETKAAREEILKEIYRDIGSQIPATFTEKFAAWRYISMLVNPTTHIRNMVGNAGFAPMLMTKNKVATVLEFAFIHDKNKRTKSVLGVKNSDLVKAAGEDFTRMGDALFSNSKYRDEVNANQYIAEGRKTFKENGIAGGYVGKSLNKLQKLNGDLLSGEDMLFKRQYYVYALASFCKARGITAEQIRSGSGLDAARAYAIREAQRATYNDANAFSDFLSRQRGTVSSLIMPFKRTPANILVRGFEYSPLGLLKSVTYDLARVHDGRITAAEAIDNIAAGITGTAVAGIGAWLRYLGFIVIKGFDGGDDDKERKFEEMYGHQQYSIEIFGKSIPLDWLAPESIPFFTGVNIAELMLDGGLSWNDVLDVIGLTLDPMMNMSMLQGINSILDSAKYSPLEAVGAIAYQIAENAVTQSLPTVIGKLERIAQPDRMTTYVDKNIAMPRAFQRTLGKVSQKIPGWDYGQIPYINAWGEKETNDSVAWRAFDQLLNPAYTSSVTESPLEKELLLLSKEVKETDVFPSRAESYFNVKKLVGKDEKTGEDVYETVRVDLTAQQYVNYAQFKGKASKRICGELINTSYYKNATAKQKREMILNAYSFANAQAKTQVSTYQPDGWVEKAIKTCGEYGVTEAQYISLYTLTQDVSGKINGETVDGYSSLQKMRLLYETSLTDEQRNAVAEALGIGKNARKLSKESVLKKIKSIEEER